ncbi:lysosomal proton-coupled steroid conjugate and bile acid symporter SLC46A3-like [Lineus longissimus]|uniref:lysosomal proton-coupled steroid conjugate and bile acid symporter SLC46A3-like n=1 Tax=Lineus longissimus TaxID=88925 RepID=UPI002B4E1E90
MTECHEEAVLVDHLLKMKGRRVKARCKRAVIVEPVLFMYALALSGSAPVIEQYLYARFKLQYPILNGTIDSNETTPCMSVNHSDPYFIATQAVQEETSQWMMYLQVTCSVISIFTTLVYGPYSDVAGRRIIMILPSAAAVIKFTFNAFVIYFNLPVWCLLFGQVLEGLCGGFETMIMIVLAYIADQTTKDTRGMRMTIAQSMLAFAMATSQLGLGYFIKATGFLYPYITLCAILVVNLVYVIFLVPETIGADRSIRYRITDFSIVRSLGATIRAFTESEDRRNVKVGLLLIISVFCSIPLISRATMIVLFTMNIPFCWGPDKIGVFAAASNAAVQLGGIASLKFFKLCRLSEMWIAAIGTLSIMASSLTNAFAETDLMMYMVVIASVFIALPIPMCKSMISRLVTVDEQGTMGAGVASVEALNNIVSSIVMNLIYQKTLFFMTGFIFVVGAISGFAGLIIILFYIAFIAIQNRQKRLV